MSVASRRLLELQADRIEMVLASHKVAGRVWGGSVSPRLVTFDVSPALGTKVKNVAGLGEEIAMALGVPRCRVYREGGSIRVEVPLEEHKSVSLLALCRQLPPSLPPVTAVLGVGRRGQPLLARLSSPDIVHILVSGTTGSGKTEVLRTMIASLAWYSRQSECQLVLIDPKARGLTPFAGLPHLLYPPLVEPADGAAALAELTVEMERRDRAGVQRPRIVVVIDELADLLMSGGAEAERRLLRLVQRGRGAGIHVVGATQKPSAQVISSLIRSNFPMRVVGRVCSAQDAQIAAGLPGTNAERLMGRGDMLAIMQGQVERFQAARIGEADIRRLVVGLCAERGRPRQLSQGN
jgi:S-DNA-T family DNA segregation ATPase FtsK/SpoIIIE